MNVVIPNLSPYNIVSKDEEGSSDGVNTGEGNKHDSVRGKKKRKFEVVEYEENCEKDLLEGKENNLHHQHNYDFKKCKKRCARLDERINQLEMELMQFVKFTNPSDRTSKKYIRQAISNYFAIITHKRKQQRLHAPPELDQQQLHAPSEHHH
ncbi:unnamed protein product [Adineta steineri]|uniref:Uncharacterized protein n=1 Tax=Adineta steineri TaxID=433720 RepID=A0A813PN51_9BILA|nr:unnamed protein product [Adineta steineri]